MRSPASAIGFGKEKRQGIEEHDVVVKKKIFKGALPLVPHTLGNDPTLSSSHQATLNSRNKTFI